MSLVLLAAAFTFRGGSQTELSFVLAEQLKVPVVTLVEDSHRVPAFIVDRPNKRDALETQIKIKAGLRATKSGRAFAPEAWPDYMQSNRFFSQPREQWGGLPVSPWKLSVKDNLIQQDYDEPVVCILGELTVPEDRRKLVISPLYRRAALAVFGKAMRSETLFRLISEAVGAKLTVTSTHVEFAFDPIEFKRRILAFYAKRIQNLERLAARSEADESEYRDCILAREAWLVAQATEVKSAADQGREVIISAPEFSRLRECVRDRTRAWANVSGTGLDRQTFANQVDWQRSVQVRLRVEAPTVSVYAFREGSKGAIQF